MTPLKGSKCIVKPVTGGHRVEWSRKMNSPFRLLIIAFMAFWLCAWCFGFITGIKQIAAGNPDKVFLMVWLGAWTVGGVFACAMTYQLLRPHVVESVTVAGGTLVYDTGTPDILEAWSQLYAGRRKLSPLAMLTKKRQQYTLNREDLVSLKMDGDAANQRLRFDSGAERVEIGSVLTEPEREWLYGKLKQKLSL